MRVSTSFFNHSLLFSFECLLSKEVIEQSWRLTARGSSCSVQFQPGAQMQGGYSSGQGDIEGTEVQGKC